MIHSHYSPGIGWLVVFSYLPSHPRWIRTEQSQKNTRQPSRSPPAWGVGERLGEPWVVLDTHHLSRQVVNVMFVGWRGNDRQQKSKKTACARPDHVISESCQIYKCTLHITFTTSGRWWTWCLWNVTGSISTLSRYVHPDGRRVQVFFFTILTTNSVNWRFFIFPIYPTSIKIKLHLSNLSTYQHEKKTTGHRWRLFNSNRLP